MKVFLKSFSLYGIIPISNKLIGFFLIPVYTSVFTPVDFGVLEMFQTAGMFAVFLVHLQIYSAVSRFFFEDTDELSKRDLTSTGLWLTLFSGFTVFIISYSKGDYLLRFLFGHTEYHKTYTYVIAWIPLTALNSYFNVMMRLIKSHRYFIFFSIVQMSVRLSSIIIFVVVLKMGVTGVFIGQIIGSLTGIIPFSYKLRKYISFCFKRDLAIKLLKFSLPIVPGLLLVGANRPFMNFIIQDNLSYNELGLYSIAIRLSGALIIIHEALRLTWQPYLYELIYNKKNSYLEEITSIYRFIFAVLIFISFPIIVFGKELIVLIAGENFVSSYLVLGYVILGSIIRSLKLIVGIGPEISKKTYKLTVVELFFFIYTLSVVMIFIKWFGFEGIGYTIISGELFRFLILWKISTKEIKIQIPRIYTFLTILIIAITNYILIRMNLNIPLKFLILLLFSGYFIIYNKEFFNSVYLYVKKYI